MVLTFKTELNAMIDS